MVHLLPKELAEKANQDPVTLFAAMQQQNLTRSSREARALGLQHEKSGRTSSFVFGHFDTPLSHNSS